MTDVSIVASTLCAVTALLTSATAAHAQFTLPIPPVASSIAKPAGTGAHLKVLPWAGFRSAVSYTFDDSSPSQIEHWPQIKAEHVRSTFYINPKNSAEAGYQATWKDVLAQGNELGNHTWHHCKATQLSGADAASCPSGFSVEAELDKTTEYIKGLGQADVWTMAYPFGDTGYLAAVKPRFLLARGVQPGLIGTNDATDPYILPIIAHAGDPTPSGGDAVGAFDADLDKAEAQGKWLVFLFHTILPTTSNWGLGENIGAITGSMEHAKAYGDMWIDSVVDVGAYWTGQKLIEHAAKSTVGETTTWTWTLPAHFPAGRVVRVIVDGGTLSQGDKPLTWDSHGYYEVALDAGSLSWAQ